MSIANRLALAAAAASCAALVSAPPAHAATLPSSGPLLNSAGTANGCTAHLDFERFSSQTSFQYTIYATCPESADIHYGQYYGSLHGVNADGTWSSIYPQSGGSWAQTGKPVTQASSTWGPGSKQFCGLSTPHTYVARASFLFRTAKGQDPYRVALQAKYTC